MGFLGIKTKKEKTIEALNKKIAKCNTYSDIESLTKSKDFLENYKGKIKENFLKKSNVIFRDSSFEETRERYKNIKPIPSTKKEWKIKLESLMNKVKNETKYLTTQQMTQYEFNERISQIKNSPEYKFMPEKLKSKLRDYITKRSKSVLNEIQKRDQAEYNEKMERSQGMDSRSMEIERKRNSEIVKNKISKLNKNLDESIKRTNSIINQNYNTNNTLNDRALDAVREQLQARQDYIKGIQKTKNY